MLIVVSMKRTHCHFHRAHPKTSVWQHCWADIKANLRRVMFHQLRSFKQGFSALLSKIKRKSKTFQRCVIWCRDYISSSDSPCNDQGSLMLSTVCVLYNHCHPSRAMQQLQKEQRSWWLSRLLRYHLLSQTCQQSTLPSTLIASANIDLYVLGRAGWQTKWGRATMLK